MDRSARVVVKRSVVVGQHKTSVSLEEEFWTSLKDIAHDKGQSIAQLVTNIDAERLHGNLSSALRLFVLQHYRGTMNKSGVPIAEATSAR
ncbi:ribbon-helix-helix domain-containing protein [Ancylobacter sp.]|uniref:ribbon-helix-helix domain-containing protein n=1 Tax=Ancylobacter sp. TaxID=1872567 RepID=UPI003D146A7C